MVLNAYSLMITHNLVLIELNWTEIYFQQLLLLYIINTVNTIQIVEKRVKEVQYLSCLPL